MTTIYNRIQNNFTQVSNLAGLNPNLSAKAFKLYWYMCYRIGTSSAWKFNKKEILKHFKEGRDSIYQAEKELIEVGFLRRIQTRESGKFTTIDYEIFSEPVNSDSAPLTEKPYTVKADTVMPYTEKTEHNNIDISNKEYNNKDYSSSDSKTTTLENLKKYKKEKKYLSDVEEFFKINESYGWEHKGKKIKNRYVWYDRFEDNYKKNQPANKTRDEKEYLSTMIERLKKSFPFHNGIIDWSEFKDFGFSIADNKLKIDCKDKLNYIQQEYGKELKESCDFILLA